MRQRVISALVGLVLLAAVLVFYQTVVFKIVIVALVLLAVFELLHAAKLQECKPLFLLCLVFSGFVPILQMQRLQNQLALICGVYAFLLFVVLIKYHATLRYEQLAYGFLVSVMIPFAFSGALFIHSRYRAEVSILYLLLALGGAWLTDSGAYFSGRAFGKHKLAPNISPKKTVEGVIGGVVTAFVFYFLITLGYTAIWKAATGVVIEVNWLALGALAPLASVAGVLGDLTASVIKRQCGIKDFGSIMPGHGGVMDRFDSVMFTLPTVYMYLQFVEIAAVR